MEIWDIIVFVVGLFGSYVLGALMFANAFPMADTDEESDESPPFW